MLLQGFPIMIDFYLLPLEGYDAVLGTQWLSTLGPIAWDFSKIKMSFSTMGNELNLQGMKTPEYKVMGRDEFAKEIKKNEKGILSQLNSLTMQKQGSKSLSKFCPKESTGELKKILQSYEDVFKEPRGLPPKEIPRPSDSSKGGLSLHSPIGILITRR